jgi:hypothetical protein
MWGDVGGRLAIRHHEPAPGTRPRARNRQRHPAKARCRSSRFFRRPHRTARSHAAASGHRDDGTAPADVTMTHKNPRVTCSVFTACQPLIARHRNGLTCRPPRLRC